MTNETCSTAHRATVEIRIQKSRGSSRGYGGPDTYVAVIVPAGVERLEVLREARIALTRAIAEAEAYAARVKAGEVL